MDVKRMFSRREKEGSAHRREKSRDKSQDRKTRPLSGDGIIALFKPDPQKKLDKEQANKVTAVKHQLQKAGYNNIDDQQIQYALASKYADGDADKATEMVVLFQESVEINIKPYNSKVNMLGAENRGNVTCYLDALLFAMFARLESFEPILYTTFEDEPRRRLSTLIRLWVNMLRTGKLIQTDVTQYLQEALAACGWAAAAEVEQQDTSEAFQKLTEILELPLLTLKVDLFHGGEEVAADDHKIVQERLLDVAIPEPKETDDPNAPRRVTLEDCLEGYFTNKLDNIKRKLERTTTNQAIPTLESTQSSVSPVLGKSQDHVEIEEVAWSEANTPVSPTVPSSPISLTRARATSIFRRIEKEEKGDTPPDSEASSSSPVSRRRVSMRKEVEMPAWQIFNLIRPSPIYLYLEQFNKPLTPDEPILIGNIAWYTKLTPDSHANVAEHFRQTRPVLGISLKRYSQTEDGKMVKDKTVVDIPLDIRLPHFVEEDAPENGPTRNFKLSLQSMICHRGDHVNSGHYVAYIRGEVPIPDGDYRSSRKLNNADHPPTYSEENWIKFDDLASPRVSIAKIDEAMNDETPYLLFYQVQPAHDYMSDTIIPEEKEPPAYTDSGIATHGATSQLDDGLPSRDQSGYFDGATDSSTPQIRLSADYDRPPTPRRSVNLPEDRRGSLAFTEHSLASTASSILATSAPVTPNEEGSGSTQRPSRSLAQFPKFTTKSRPTSQSGESRISATFSRMSLMRSKEQLKPEQSNRDSAISVGERGSPTNSKDQLKAQTSKDGDSAILVNEGPNANAHRKSVSIDETTLRPEKDTSGRLKSKKGKKRDKSRDPSENGEHDGHSHHLHKGKARANEGKQELERECKVM